MRIQPALSAYGDVFECISLWCCVLVINIARCQLQGTASGIRITPWLHQEYMSPTARLRKHLSSPDFSLHQFVKSTMVSADQTSFPKPLKQSGALEQFTYEDTTPVIGREFFNVNIVDDLLYAPNADQLIQDLAITSMLSLQLSTV